MSHPPSGKPQEVTGSTEARGVDPQAIHELSRQAAEESSVLSVDRGTDDASHVTSAEVTTGQIPVQRTKPSKKGAVELGSMTQVQWVGLWLAVGVGFLILCVTLGLGWAWASNMPKIPNLPSTTVTSQEITSTQRLIESYTSLSTAAIDAPSKLFDQVVVRTLLPVFTAILGYIFGTKIERREKDSEA